MTTDIQKLLTEAGRLKAYADRLRRQAYEADSMTPWRLVKDAEKEAQAYIGKAGRLANAALAAAVKALAIEIDYPLTWGYIGTASPSHDDRGWCVFAPHPGRIGATEDRLACGSSDDLPRALELFELGTVKAWALAHKLEEI